MWRVLIALACRSQTTWEWLTRHRSNIYASLGVLAIGVGFLNFRPNREILNIAGLSWLALFYSALVLLAIVNPGPLVRFVFGKSPLVKLGSVAYAVYMIHEGVNGLLHYAIRGQRPTVEDIPGLAITSLSLATVLVLSFLSWRIMESPLIRRAHCRYTYVSGRRKVAYAQAGT